MFSSQRNTSNHIYDRFNQKIAFQLTRKISTSSGFMISSNLLLDAQMYTYLFKWLIPLLKNVRIFSKSFHRLSHDHEKVIGFFSIVKLLWRSNTITSCLFT